MGSLILTAVDFVYNWARSNSLWPFTFATSCCGIEMISSTMANYDLARFGSEVFRASPRQADLLIVAGTITHKMAPVVLRLYEQMPEPKYVIAMGACACSGGMFVNDSYSVVYGVDKILPVDIYVPMCPPKPEALIDGIIKLQKKIKSETIKDRQKYIEEHKAKLKASTFQDDELLEFADGMNIYSWGLLNKE